MCRFGGFRGTWAAVVLLSPLLATRPAAAHGLGAECKLRDGRVQVEAYFDDDTVAADARIVVRDAAQNITAEGRTDAKGLWSFAAPAAGLYRVTVDAGAGHRTTVRIRVPAPAEESAATTSAASGECDCCKGNNAASPTFGGPVISEGPRRAEFTRFPWLKVVLGLTAIALMGLIWWGFRRWKLRFCSSGPSPSRPASLSPE